MFVNHLDAVRPNTWVIVWYIWMYNTVRPNTWVIVWSIWMYIFIMRSVIIITHVDHSTFRHSTLCKWLLRTNEHIILKWHMRIHHTTRIVWIRPKGRTQCIFPRYQQSCLYVYIYWPKVNLYQVVVGQQSVRTLFKSLAQLFL